MLLTYLLTYWADDIVTWCIAGLQVQGLNYSARSIPKWSQMIEENITLQRVQLSVAAAESAIP